MAVGDAERAFAAAAEADGLILERASVPWINQRGHFGLPAHAVRARASLNEIFTALGGDRAEQESKKLTPLRGDFIEVSTGTFIEIDELQHFTSFRAASLQLYPPAAPLGFGRDDYLDLCTSWRRELTGTGQPGPPRVSARVGGSGSAHTMTRCVIWAPRSAVGRRSFVCQSSTETGRLPTPVSETGSGNSSSAARVSLPLMSASVH